MWYQLGRFILRQRTPLIIILVVYTGLMSYFTSQVKMSYDFSRAVPTDNQKYIDYQNFLKRFAADGSSIVLGIESDKTFTPQTFNQILAFHQNLKKLNGVIDVLDISEAMELLKDSATGKLQPHKIFPANAATQAELDSAKAKFHNQIFYRGLMYNPCSNAYLFLVNVKKDVVESKKRTALVNEILEQIKGFEKESNIQVHISGLPYIRTVLADRIKKEMNLFLAGSILLSALILFLFFRSFSATVMSLLVVGIGVVSSMGTMVLLGYKITLLTVLIPPLVVVIGIPNCIYFLNKFHSSYLQSNDKQSAIVNMVGRMGIVTLFCNIAAAIGFTVFAFTRSQLLKEFGVVSGINIMLLFFISLVFIPIVLNWLPAPKPQHVKYLDNKLLEKFLIKVEKWALHHTNWVYAVSLAVVVFAVIGIFRLKSEGFIVDDLPKTDNVYTDLKWFEQNFKGVMPLEIVVDTKKKYGALKMETLQNIDSLSNYIAAKPEVAKPFSIVEALKFGNQAFYDNDSNSYVLPLEIPASISTGLRSKMDNKTGVARLAANFIDSTQQYVRISTTMKDIGSKQLPIFLNDVQNKANEIFDSTKYNITFTGSSVTFLEGTRFIINGLKESIFWAFLLIALAMLWLFKSVRILVCSLIPNIIPLVITAGVMGWAGVALKPSTVLVFSVALGIVIDVTIRFLVNYKQELPQNNYQVEPTLIQTIKHTGISIIYTSLVLIAGFIIFCFSHFGGTFALGWLTSLTLLVGTLTNLVLLPALMMLVLKKKSRCH